MLIFCKGMVFVNITGRFNAIQKTLAVVLDENCPTRPRTIEIEKLAYKN